jgi:hypothetical protein
MHTMFNRTKHLIESLWMDRRPASAWVAARSRWSCVSLVTIGMAMIAVSPGSALAGQPSARAHAAASPATSCEDVTGDTWTIPGAGEPSGDSYVVVAQNIGCFHARLLGAYMALGGAGLKGWKCTRHKHFNGDCKHTIRRRHRRTLQVVGWYPDISRPNGP